MASHIGKLPVTVPAGVEVKIEGQNFSVKGAKGSDSYVIPEGITAAVEGNEIVLTPAVVSSVSYFLSLICCKAVSDSFFSFSSLQFFSAFSSIRMPGSSFFVGFS